MNQMKILKLAKRLNRFTLDDISTTLELNKEEEKNVLEYLEALAQKALIKKISDDRYQYIDKKNQKFLKKPEKTLRQIKMVPKVKINPKIIDISKDDNYQLYLNSSASIKKRVDKYLTVIHSAGGLSGKHLEVFLGQWNEQFPEMKTSRTSFMKIRKLLIARGLAGLLLNHNDPANNTKKQIHNVIYNYFKGYYLTHKRIALTKSVDLANKKFKRLNPEINNYKPASASSFRKRLAAEYSKEEIKQFRAVKIKGVKNIAGKTSYTH